MPKKKKELESQVPDRWQKVQDIMKREMERGRLPKIEDIKKKVKDKKKTAEQERLPYILD